MLKNKSPERKIFIQEMQKVGKWKATCNVSRPRSKSYSKRLIVSWAEKSMITPIINVIPPQEQHDYFSDKQIPMHHTLKDPKTQYRLLKEKVQAMPLIICQPHTQVGKDS
jgi:hypothetical protein